MEKDLDTLFRLALEAIDAGDRPALEALLDEHPQLAVSRLEEPGEWLRSQIGQALDGFFSRTYLLWFISEDAERAGRLPADICDLARAIINAARKFRPESLPEQLDEALKLVCWSGVAAKSGHQLDLIDLLIDEGAQICSPDVPLVNRHKNACQRLIERGSKVTLSAAGCLGLWSEFDQLAKTADSKELQAALVLACMNAEPRAIEKLIQAGADVNRNDSGIHEHGMPLHHAAWSGSLESIQILTSAGARISARDSAWDGTPLDWADHGGKADAAALLRKLSAASNVE